MKFFVGIMLFSSMSSFAGVCKKESNLFTSSIVKAETNRKVRIKSTKEMGYFPGEGIVYLTTFVNKNSYGRNYEVWSVLDDRRNCSFSRVSLRPPAQR